LPGPKPMTFHYWGQAQADWIHPSARRSDAWIRASKRVTHRMEPVRLQWPC